jgi:hypothetical protein
MEKKAKNIKTIRNGKSKGVHPILKKLFKSVVWCFKEGF